MGKNKKLIHTITTMAMFSAISYVATLVFHYLSIHIVPAVEFLSYDPKDALICIAGFACGPIEGLIITIIVSFLEMITFSTTGPYGLIMNIIQTASFVIPAAIIYKNKKTFKGAIFALITGYVVSIVTMTLWNIIITPIYYQMDRKVFINTLLSFFVLFNVLKTGLNIGLTLFLYKPLVSSLRAIGIMERKENKTPIKSILSVCAIGLVIIVTVIIIVLILK